MTQFEKAWVRMRAVAEKMASNVATPSLDEAKKIVRRIVQDEHGETLPPGAIDYLAAEFHSLIGHYRGDGKRSTQGVPY